jgi:hypothetical protein
LRTAANTQEHPARRFIDACSSACPTRRIPSLCAHQFWHCSAHRIGSLCDRLAPTAANFSRLKDAYVVANSADYYRVPSKAPQQRSLLERVSLWICGQHKSVAHKTTGPTAAADDLNDLEISSVRTTLGSLSEAALKATRHGLLRPLSAVYTRVLIAVHTSGLSLARSVTCRQ